METFFWSVFIIVALAAGLIGLLFWFARDLDRIQASFVRPMNVRYLVCRHCARPFSLFAGTRKTDFRGLPDPFEATCPHCQWAESYVKVEVQEMRPGELANS